MMVSGGKAPSILVVSGVRGDTRRYRALHLFEQFRLCGIEASYIHLTDVRFLQVIESKAWDVVVLHRTPYPEYLGMAIERLKQKGTLLLCDFDDLLFDPTVFQFINSPDFADTVRSTLYQETMRKTQQILAYADGALASTNFLAEQIRQLNKLVWVHRNAFSLEMLSICAEVNAVERKQSHARVVIGYASGTPTHNRDFEMIRPALKQVMEKYPQVELRIIGPLDPGDDWGAAGNRITRLKLVPWRRLPWLLSNFDINLAPLVMDNPFSQSKSEIKYMEAAMVGVPTVASPTDAFAFAIRSGHNGYLACGHEDWVETLSTLVEDAPLRKAVGNLARETVLVNYHPQTRAEELVNRLEEINQSLEQKPFWRNGKPSPDHINLQSRKVAADSVWIPQRYEKGPSYVQMGFFSLRTIGLKATLQFVWVFFRRMISPIIPYKKQGKA